MNILKFNIILLLTIIFIYSCTEKKNYKIYNKNSVYIDLKNDTISCKKVAKAEILFPKLLEGKTYEDIIDTVKKIEYQDSLKFINEIYKIKYLDKVNRKKVGIKNEEGVLVFENKTNDIIMNIEISYIKNGIIHRRLVDYYYDITFETDIKKIYITKIDYI